MVPFFYSEEDVIETAGEYGVRAAWTAEDTAAVLEATQTLIDGGAEPTYAMILEAVTKQAQAQDYTPNQTKG